MTDGLVEFEFDLPDALLTSLVNVFDKMKGAALIHDAVNALPDAQGVYQLLLNNAVVYIGKTDGDAGLRRRLLRHAGTIQQRKNLPIGSVSFKAVRVFVFTAIDLETQLIRHYEAKAPVLWQKSGFGSNDPGRNRDDTDMAPDGFDAKYPIDLDQPIDVELRANMPLSNVTALLRAAVPYYFRVEVAQRGKRGPHPDLASAVLKADLKQPTMSQALNAILTALPEGWQATSLAGRVILYKENREYKYGTSTLR